MSKDIISSRLMTQADFNDLNTKTVYKMKGHTFGLLKGVGKQYCHKCGLVALNNPISHWANKKGCNYKDHSHYLVTLKRLTKL